MKLKIIALMVMLAGWALWPSNTETSESTSANLTAAVEVASPSTPNTHVMAPVAQVDPLTSTAVVNSPLQSYSETSDASELADLNGATSATVAFGSLPVPMQQEIIQLSGRDAQNQQVVEVSPGVFLMTKGPRVVPIAVINEDGTVTTHEY